MAILNDDEFTEFEGRSYLNPQIALDESNTFIDNLRQTQQANNQQIKTDTYNLGTAVPSNLGGLTGPESYFSSRYQTPQTNSAVADLRSAAQAAALNQILANQQSIYQKRYNDAYRSYQKRSGGGGSGGSSGGSGGGNGDNTSTWDGSVTDKSTDLTAVDTFSLDSNTEGDMGVGIKWVVNPATIGQDRLEYFRIDETKDPSDPEYQTIYRQQDDGTLVRVR